MTKEQKFEARLTEMGLLNEWNKIGRMGRVATTDANGNIILFVHEDETDAYSEIHYPPFQVLRQNYKFVKNCILEWKGYDEEFEKKLDDWLAYGMCSETGCPLDPVDVYFPADGLQTSYEDFEDDDLFQGTVARLSSFFQEGFKGETVEILNAEQAEELNGCSEPLYATLVGWDGQRAVIVHFGINGDWTKAVTITEDAFNNTAGGERDFSVEEALEWFFGK